MFYLRKLRIFKQLMENFKFQTRHWSLFISSKENWCPDRKQLFTKWWKIAARTSKPPTGSVSGKHEKFCAAALTRSCRVKHEKIFTRFSESRSISTTSHPRSPKKSGSNGFTSRNELSNEFPYRSTDHFAATISHPGSEFATNTTDSKPIESSTATKR